MFLRAVAADKRLLATSAQTVYFKEQAGCPQLTHITYMLCFLMGWAVKFAGKPVEREFNRLKPSLRGALIELLRTVQKGGPQSLDAHEARPLKGKMWEFRVSAEDGIGRALYVAVTGQMVLVLHIFEKKTQKTPPDAIKLAEKRLREYAE